MVESQTHNLKVVSLSLSPAGIIGGGGVNVQRSLHPQYHDWGETHEQDTELLTAPRVPQNKCLPTAVCVLLDG